MLQFGPGGSSALDTWLNRIAPGAFEVKNDLVPTGDNAGKIGYAAKRWSEIRALNIYGGNLLPDTDNTYDIGENSTPKRWRDIYLSGAIKALGGVAVDLLPNTTSAYDLGSASKVWRDLYLGGAIKSLLGGVAVDLLPDTGLTRNLGSLSKQWYGIWCDACHASDYLHVMSGAKLLMEGEVRGPLINDGSGAYDLGSATAKWSNLYVSGVGDLGWLTVGAYIVITSGRVLQNLTADVAIITSGQFGLGRMPRSTSGYVLEAQGAGFDPMYVNPNARYTPAGHDHAAANITSGVLAEARCPNVYSGQITYNGGIVTNSVNCANFSATDLVFENDFSITEGEKLGLGKGLAFLNPKGKILLFLDEAGNVEVFGKLKQRSSRLKMFWKKLERRVSFAS
jgi:hypothetical protein